MIFQTLLDPNFIRAGKMVIWGVIFSCVDPILSIAASLTYKSPFYEPMTEHKVLKAKDKKFEFTMGEFSDHVALAVAVRKYEAVAHDRQKTDKLCKDYFLVRHTLKTIVDLKVQIAALLFDMHFLPTKEYWGESVNKNSKNKALVKATICAGLFPNVAYLM